MCGFVPKQEHAPYGQINGNILSDRGGSLDPSSTAPWHLTRSLDRKVGANNLERCPLVGCHKPQVNYWDVHHKI